MFTSGKVLIAEIRISTTHYPATVPFLCSYSELCFFPLFLKIRSYLVFFPFFSFTFEWLTRMLFHFRFGPIHACPFVHCRYLFSTVYFHSHRLNLSGKWNVEIQVPILQQRVSLILLHFTWVERFVKVGC